MGVKERYDAKKNSNPDFKTSGVKQRYEQQKKHKSFIEDTNNLITKYNTIITTDYSKYGDYSSHIQQYDGFASNANSLLKQLDGFKDLISEDDYKKISDTLSSIATKSDTQKKNVQGFIDFYGKFEDENQYNAWIEEGKKEQKALKEDAGALQTELDGLNNVLSQAKKLQANIDTYTNRGNAFKKRSAGLPTDGGNYSKANQYKKQLNDLLAQYGYSSLSQLEKDVAEKQRYYDYANNLQTKAKLSGVTDSESEFYDPECEKYIAIGKEHYESTHIKSPTLADIPNINFDQKGYYSGNIEKMEDYKSKLYSFEYANMESEERRNYLYWLGKAVEEANGGEVNDEIAEKYVSYIEEAINYRRGQQMAKDADGNLFSQYVISAASGIDGFVNDVKNAFNTESDNIPNSVFSFAAQQVRKDLEDNTFNFWYNIKEGKWEDKAFGSSLGQIGHDLISNASRMAVPMALSYIPFVGKYLSLAATGVSAYGGAYKEKLNAGYTKEQARNYSIMVGISEAALQYFLGGISKLGGKKSVSSAITNLVDKLDNVYVRAAVKLELSSDAEGLEEGLQSFLEPLFHSIATGETFEAPEWNDILYDGFIGKMSGYLFEGSSVISEVSVEHNLSKIGSVIIEGGNVDTVLMAAEYMGSLDPEIKGQVQALNDYNKTGKNGKTNAAYKRTLGKVAATVAENVTEVKQSVTEKAVSNELKNRGVDSKTIGKVSKIVSKFLSGQKLSSSEQGYLQHNSVAATVMHEIEAAQEQVKAGTLPQSPTATAPSTDGANVQSTAPQWAVDLVNKLTTIDSAMSVINLAVNGKSAESTGNSEVNRMIKILSIASGKTTAEQEAEAGDIPYSQYIKEKEAAAKKENTAENSGDTSPMENVDGGNNTENGDAPNIFEEVFSEENRNEKMSRVQSLGKKIGTPVTFSEEVKRGKYNPQTREITLNPNLTIGQMYMFVFKHEWVHDLKNRRLWAGYKNFLFNDSLNFTDFCETHLLNDYGIEAKGQDAIAQLRDKYYENWRNSDEMTAEEKAAFDMEAAEEEMVCDFVAERQLGGIRKDGNFAQESFDALSELANRKRNIFQRLIDWIKGVIDWIKGDPQFTDMADELQYLNERLARVYESRVTETGETVTKHSIEDNSIKQQLHENAATLNSMDVVASYNTSNTFEYNQQVVDWVMQIYEGIDYKVTREGFGDVVVDEKRIKRGVRYAKTYAEKIAFALIPDVLKEGVQIGAHVKHKNRPYDTVTFAAPVELNGLRGNMAVVVRKESNNYYKAHRIVMPDGTQMLLDEKRDTAERAGGVENNSGLSPTDNVSTDIIPENANDVNNNSSVPESHSIAIPFSDEFKANKRKRYAEGVAEKYGGAIDAARVEGYLKDIAEATENKDYRKAYKIAAKAAKYIADNGAYTIEKMVYKKKARELLRSFITDDMIIGSKSELNDKFMEAVEHLKEYYFNQFDENAKTDAEILIEEVARELAEAPSRDSDMYRQVQEIRDYVRAVRLRSPDGKYDGDFGEGYEAFRKKNRGRIWLSKSGDVSVDAFYDELRSEFGEEFFPADITTVPDQLKRISEVVNLEATLPGVGSENIAEATEYIKEKLTQSVNEIFENSQNDSLVKAEDDLAEQIFDTAVYNRTEELSYKASEAQRKLAEKRHNELRGYIAKTDKQVQRAQRINGQFDELLKQDREARAIRQDRQKNIEAIRKTVNRLYKRLIANSNTKNIPEDFKEAVTELCEIFFRSDISTFDRRDFHTLSTMYKNLQGNSERSMAGEDTFDPEVSSMIDTIADTLHGRKLQELDYLQVMLLRDIIDNINHIISEEAGIMLAGKKYEIDTLGRAAMQEFKAKQRVSDWKPIEGARNFFKYNNMTPVYFFDRVGGTLKKLYKEIRNGMDKIALNLDATKGYIAKTKEQFNYDSWKNEKIEFTTDNGETLTLSIEQALHLYATAKRELTNTLQNSKHLFGGGIVLKGYKGIAERIKNINKSDNDSRSNLEKILVDEINNTAIQITLQDITRLSATLTDEQVGYMDAMVKYMSENMAALGNETSLQLYGIRKFNENYYIPYNSAEEYISSQPGYKAPKTHQSASFTKNTIRGANTPLVVESFSEVVARHCNQMIQYNALAVPLSNFNKVYNFTSNIGDEDVKSRSLKNSISSVMGEGARKYIDRFLEDMNGDIRTVPGEEIGSKLLRLHKASAVMASASVVVQQPASIGRAMAYIGPQYFVDLRPHQGDYEQMKKYAPVAILKEMGRFDTGVGSSTTQWLLATDPKGIKNKSTALLKNEDGYRDDIFSAAAGKADEIAWGMMWAAAKNKVAHDTNLTRNSEEFLQEAGRIVSEVIDRTQVYDSTISRSQMMRSKSLWAQMVTSFMAEPTVTLNMLYDMAHDINSKHFKLAGKKLGAVIFTAVLTAALKSFVTAARDDEEDKSYWEKYFRDLVGESFDNLNIANMIPIVRDVYSLVQGYDVERADMTAFDSLVEAFGVAFDEEKEPLEKLEKVASSIGTFTGIPIKNIWRDMEATYNVVVNNILNPKNKTTGQGIKYAMQEGLPFGTEDSKSENYERLLEAAESGDKEAYKKIYNHLIELGADDSDIKTGLKKEIKEDSEEYEDEFQNYMNRLYKMAFFNSLEDDEKKKVENNLSNFLAEDIETEITGQKPTKAHEKVKEAQKEGVSPEYYYLSKIATNVDNADTDGSGTVTKKERLAAIRKMNVSNDIKAALIALYS